MWTSFFEEHFIRKENVFICIYINEINALRTDKRKKRELMKFHNRIKEESKYNLETLQDSCRIRN